MQRQRLDAKQGMIVSRDNLRNLVLKDEVIDASEAGQFHIYGVSSINEGIEVLTGVPAGTPQENGSYPKSTVHYLVEQHLRELAQKASEYTKCPSEDPEKGEEKKASHA